MQCFFGEQIHINKKLLLKNDFLQEKLSVKETNDITNLSHHHISEDKNNLIFNFNNLDSLNKSLSEMDDNANIVSEQTPNQMNIFNNDIEDDEYNRVYFIAKNNNKNTGDNSQIKNTTVSHTFETIKMGRKRGRKSIVNKIKIQRERADDLEIKIFNNFFKMICYLISILTSRLGEDYKINKINKKSEDTDSQKKRKIFYEK